MPIASGAIGLPGIVAVPGTWRLLQREAFQSAPLSTKNEIIPGVTRDSTGAPLAGCVVQLFRTPSDTIVAETVSDGAGAYSFDNPGSGPFYIVAYKPGAPDVGGTTANTIVAT